jgi:hypothetical protein
MASLRIVALAMAGGTASIMAMSALVAGCGGDDTNGNDSGTVADATNDVATTDVSVQETGHPDTGGGDAKADAPAVDAGHDADATTAMDADSGTADADAGTAHDADAGTAHDADAATTDADADAGEVDADAGPTLTAAQIFAAGYAQAYCQGYLHCCDGYDAGAIDLGRCATEQYGQASQETTFPLGSAGALTAGHLIIDQDAAAGCFVALSNLACVIAAADNAAATNPCFGVISGNIPLGGTGCVTSFECVNGGYCNLPGDGGAGTCLALVADGGTCATQDMCSAAQLVPTSYCTAIDTGSPTGVCAPLVPDNGACASDMECTAEFCFAGGGTQCGGTGVLNTSSGLCQTYAIVSDAGGD